MKEKAPRNVLLIDDEETLESGKQDAFMYLLKPVDYDTLVDGIYKAYEKKLELQAEKFKEKIEEICKSGLGPKGIKKAIDELSKTYGIE